MIKSGEKLEYFAQKNQRQSSAEQRIGIRNNLAYFGKNSS